MKKTSEITYRNLEEYYRTRVNMSKNFNNYTINVRTHNC